MHIIVICIYMFAVSGCWFLMAVWIGNSKNTVGGYCLDIPRFEEPLNN